MRTEPCLSDVSSLAIECRDCGHSRWRRPAELYRLGFRPSSSIPHIGGKLFCSPCRNAGLPAKNIAIDVMFVTAEARREAELFKLTKTPTTRVAG
jgi:hypothetical protein